jgi:hypothetical protein
MDKKTADRVQEFLKNHPVEIDWDYDSGLSEKQIELLLEGGDSVFEAEEEIWKDNDYWIWELERDAFRYALEELDLLPEDADGETVRKMRVELIDRHGVYATIDPGLERLARQTKAHLAASLSVEHNGYWEDYDDVRDELEFLGINPADLREHFPEVRWYACPTRKDPLISVDALVDAWINCCYGGYWYVLLDASDVLKLAVQRKLDGKLVVKKGASIIIHDYWNGSSSVDVEILKDIVIDADDIFDDGNNRYGIQSTCGLWYGSWSGEVECLQQNSKD